MGIRHVVRHVVETKNCFIRQFFEIPQFVWRNKESFGIFLLVPCHVTLW